MSTHFRYVASIQNTDQARRPNNDPKTRRLAPRKGNNRDSSSTVRRLCRDGDASSIYIRRQFTASLADFWVCGKLAA